MPELVEVKLTSEFINHNSKNRKFTSVYKVLNNNQIVEKINLELEPFQIISESNGKELTLSLKDSRAEKKIWVFMGMTGNFEFIETKNWNKNKFTRLRIDSEDGFSLVMFGGFMGPKFSLQKFKSKRGPDLTKDFNSFKNNILNNLNNIDFKKPLPEVLINQKWFNGIGAYLRYKF